MLEYLIVQCKLSLKVVRFKSFETLRTHVKSPGLKVARADSQVSRHIEFMGKYCPVLLSLKVVQSDSMFSNALNTFGTL